MGSASEQNQSLIKAVGPWGGEEGSEWNYMAPNGTGIAEIIINHGWRVDSLTFKSVNESNSGLYSQKFGGDGGDTTKISIEWPHEYLISISGTYGPYFGETIISSINFYTNRNKFGPFGRRIGTPFEVALEENGVADRDIVGFFGRAGQYINAIGVYLQVPSQPIVIVQPREGITMSMNLPRDVGPWGGNKGKAWDHGVFGAIERIDVHVGRGIIYAIEFRYRTRDGELVTYKEGGQGATTISRIRLEDNSTEYLVGIMGYYGPIEGNCCSEVVSSISFYTNKGKYGPFGTETGTFFSSPVSNAKVVGFHGRSSKYLDALGVHMEYS